MISTDITGSVRDTLEYKFGGNTVQILIIWIDKTSVKQDMQIEGNETKHNLNR